MPRFVLQIFLGFAMLANALATPANKTALARHYDSFLADSLNRCTACHLPSGVKNPESLDEFPHNPFGKRLRALARELDSKSIPERLKAAATEDSDDDGIPNEAEILLGHNPGDPQDKPADLARLDEKQKRFAEFLNSYRWEPFRTVARPAVPNAGSGWARNEIDSFIAAAHSEHGLKPRPQAPKEILLRRAYIDLIGLNPTPEERRRFLADKSSDAYERLVDRLLEDPRYGERWGRHWMDIWRYSDWAGWSGGNQIRDSQPHIWRWRDWIVESLNADKPYDQMLREMLAADELAPGDTNALRATGFLVRNYKKLSREQWLDDTIKHSSQAFLGVTIGCAKCHDHRTDPISQEEYYRYRALFEPHNVRIDRIPGQLDRSKNGLVRAYDADLEKATYFFERGDERKPDTNRVMQPGVPRALRWASSPPLAIEPITLPESAAHPDRRGFVIADTLAASEKSLEETRTAHKGTPLHETELALALAETKHEALLRLLRIEELDESGESNSTERAHLAASTAELQKKAALLDAKLALHGAESAERKLAADSKAKKSDLDSAQRKVAEAGKALAEAQMNFEKSWGTEFTPRPVEEFPATSTGRRAAFARWLTDTRNPLAARVAVNHIWLRHFGRGIVTTPENFGALGASPSHPELLDWLAAEFMSGGWSMKSFHRKILISATYRIASTPDESNLQSDPDNIYLWRMPSRRLDAELVRDNLLWVAGDLDLTMGGPEIDNQLGLTSRRRSIYLRIAAEKEVEFLKIFDGPAVTECYQRHTTVMPQQALALGNSKIALAQARSLSTKLSDSDSDDFITAAFERILARLPTEDEHAACADFLYQNGGARLPSQSGARPSREVANPNLSSKLPPSQSARENLILVLLNHNDFVTIR